MAAPGDLDRRFGIGGVAATSFEPQYGASIASALVVAADGKIVVAGRAASKVAFPGTGDTAMAALRYLGNGRLDTSFGVGGRMAHGIGTVSTTVIQPDGKILLGGAAISHPFTHRLTRSDFAVLRLLPNGQPDPDFATGGLAVTVFGDPRDPGSAVQFSSIHTLAVLPDGAIIAAGTAPTTADFRAANAFAVVRYAPDGSLDTGFATDGRAITPFGETFRDAATALACEILPDGSITLAGTATRVSATNRQKQTLALARYRANGEPDVSFGSGGKRAVELPGKTATTVAFDLEGRILAAGEIPDPAGQVGSRWAISRYLADATPDGTFGAGGVVELDLTAGADRPSALAIDTESRILIAGCADCDEADGPKRVALVRLLDDGARDPAFGEAGVSLTRIGREVGVTSIAVRAGDEALVGGEIGSEAESAFSVLAFLGDVAPPSLRRRLFPVGDGRLPQWSRY